MSDATPTPSVPQPESTPARDVVEPATGTPAHGDPNEIFVHVS